MPQTTDRDVAIKAIRQALKTRSGKAWSVTGGRGTAWGWIRIRARKSEIEFGGMFPAQCQELAALLSLDTVHHQGISIPASSAYYTEYVARAEGRTPETLGTPYWD